VRQHRKHDAGALAPSPHDAVAEPSSREEAVSPHALGAEQPGGRKIVAQCASAGAVRISASPVRGGRAALMGEPLAHMPICQLRPVRNRLEREANPHRTRAPLMAMGTRKYRRGT
jgi:hypothetical protein